jgi:wyosine [tRNA(Phe)-imidazoG37] synthetase (radical SAM superfamily)
MNYVFGPVPSRRLGISLGIDTIPLKTCNWNCVYCQLGRTKPLVNDRKEYYPREDILDEIQTTLSAHPDGEIDWITFVGSGEPTLHQGIGWLIRSIKKFTSIPVAVITNGSLLYLLEVRQGLEPADAVLPSLDAGNPILYRKINRPHPKVSFEKFIDGLIRFQSTYEGNLWVETMLIKDLNDTEDALQEIAECLSQIGPDEVHINLPTRPPVETWVKPPDEEGILRARAILGKIAKVVHPAEGSFNFKASEDLVETIINIVSRHPIRAEELTAALNQQVPEKLSETLQGLHSSERAQIIERYGVEFWVASPSNYPDEKQSIRTAPK